jgi:hypothetical protein
MIPSLHDGITTVYIPAYIMVSKDALKESAIRGYRRDIDIWRAKTYTYIGLWDNLYRSSVHK